MSAALCLAAAPSQGQQTARRSSPELRVDVLGGDRSSVQLGAGLNVPMGPYVRLGAFAGLGAATSDGGDGGGSGAGRTAGRVDLLARFLLDPFRQSRWGVSAGGGVSARAEPGDRLRPHLLLVLDVEGRRTAQGLSPAFQLGLGGGVRAGVGLRWNQRTSR